MVLWSFISLFCTIKNMAGYQNKANVRIRKGNIQAGLPAEVELLK